MELYERVNAVILKCRNRANEFHATAKTAGIWVAVTKTILYILRIIVIVPLVTAWQRICFLLLRVFTHKVLSDEKFVRANRATQKDAGRKKPRYLAFTHADIPFMLQAGSPLPPPANGTWLFNSTHTGFFPENILENRYGIWMHLYQQACKLSQQRIKKGKALLAPKGGLLDWFPSYSLLPMDSLAVCFAQNSGLPYALPNTFCTLEEIQNVMDTGKSAMLVWAERFPYKELGFSENWALYDTLGFFDNNYFPAQIAAMLARRFQEREAHLVVLHRRPSLFYEPIWSSNLPANIWSAALQERALTIQYPRPLEELIPQQQDWSCLHGAVVFAFHEGCTSRFDSVMNKTRINSGLPVVWMPFYSKFIPRSYALEALQQGGATYGQFPVRSLPFPGEDDLHLPAHAGKLCQEAAESIFPYTAHLRVFFEEYAIFLARLEAQSRMLRAIWSEFRPRLCLVDNLSRGEHAVPLLVCRQLGIPSIGLPEAALLLPELKQPVLPATRQSFASAFTEDAFIETKSVTADKAGSFDSLFLENEYSTQHYEQLLPHDNLVNILVVTLPPLLTIPLTVYRTEKCHMDALRKIDDVPSDLHQLIRMTFKTHPATPEFWDYRHAGIEQNHVLPRDSSMADALLSTEVLISLNYIGSPSCQAMKKGIPVITCLTTGKLGRDMYSLKLADMGLMSETPEETWEYIRRLIFDDKFRDVIIARQKEFCEAWLRPRRDDWCAWLKETIEEGA